jgi:EAL domain-containing protein (putative c-di-GMP-specific phosphodiesterase class I)
MGDTPMLDLDGIPEPADGMANGTSPVRRLDPQQVSEELVELEAKFERCVATVAMHYQPIVWARPWQDKKPSLFGYEALLRTVDKSLPHPGAILDAAERLERVTKLGRLLRTKVAQQFATAPEDRGVAFVNLHANDLFDRTITSPFSPLTKVARRVVLEITERNSLDGLADLRYRVAELRELGFRIAIDDLGGGHARMGHFTPLDTDFVKLDMSLVRDCDSHPVKQRLIESITQLCRDNGTKVIGEGVETMPEAETLIRLGCDLLQGYLVARPALPFCEV